MTAAAIIAAIILLLALASIAAVRDTVDGIRTVATIVQARRNRIGVFEQDRIIAEHELAGRAERAKRRGRPNGRMERRLARATTLRERQAEQRARTAAQTAEQVAEFKAQWRDFRKQVTDGWRMPR